MTAGKERPTTADPADLPPAGAAPSPFGDEANAADAVVTGPEPKLSKEERQAKLAEAYTEATRQLREAHLEEFNSLRKTAAKARGIDWEPALTPAQKAEEQVRKLLSEHPDVAKKLGVEK